MEDGLSRARANAADGDGHRSTPKSLILLGVLTSTLFISVMGCGPTGDGGPHPGTLLEYPDTEAYREYAQQCLEATKKFNNAQVVFDPKVSMIKDRSSTVTAVVTLNTQLPADDILPGVQASSRPVKVACEVEANLVVDSGEFGVSPSDFSSRSVLKDQDATWQWLVTPRRVGDFTIMLQLRPVVLVGENSDSLERHNVTVLSVTSAVHVTHKNWLAAFGDWLKSTMGMLTALATLIAAISGAVFAVHQFFVKPNVTPPTS